MANEVHHLTFAEIHAYEAKARLLRAEAMRSGIKESVKFAKSIIRGAVSLISRPAHA